MTHIPMDISPRKYNKAMLKPICRSFILRPIRITKLDCKYTFIIYSELSMTFLLSDLHTEMIIPNTISFGGKPEWTFLVAMWFARKELWTKLKLTWDNCVLVKTNSWTCCQFCAHGWTWDDHFFLNSKQCEFFPSSVTHFEGYDTHFNRFYSF